ncbi:uncharacterized protein LOC142221510 [Haematobia irritans]|uniref:uncharacterized protein LOC142221510 n=1 Tax=Haematobia irritans TaxID=7368 RepID=UPI003F4F683E
MYLSKIIITILMMAFGKFVFDVTCTHLNIRQNATNGQDQHNDFATLSVRLPSNILLKYSSYKDVAILHFLVPSDTRRALFTFKAREEAKSVFQIQCKPQDVSLYLKANGYPVINPENITFPKNFINKNQRFKTYGLQFQSDDIPQHVVVDSPEIGNWFAVAFISWVDPSKDKIEQQGIAASCNTELEAEMSVDLCEPIITTRGQDHNNTLHTILINARNAKLKDTHNEIIYKIFVPANVVMAKALIKFREKCLNCPLVGLHVQANAIPYLHQSPPDHKIKRMQNTYFQANDTSQITINFDVRPLTWHYLLLRFHEINATDEYLESSTETPPIEEHLGMDKRMNYSVRFNFQIDYKQYSAENFESKHKLFDEEVNSLRPTVLRNIEFYPLLRQTYRDFFSFDYELEADENGTVPTTLNLTGGVLVGFTFNIGEVYDVGGTLSLVISMNVNDTEEQRKKPRLSIIEDERTEKFNDKFFADDPLNSALDGSEKRNQTIIVCMNHGDIGEPVWPNQCRYGKILLPASFVINNANSTTNRGILHIPFPEAGSWFITMGLYCDNNNNSSDRIEVVKEFLKKYAYMLDVMHPKCPCIANRTNYRNCLKDPICFASMNDSDVVKIKGCLLDSKCSSKYLEMVQNFDNHQKISKGENVTSTNCSSSIVFSIGSGPCISGKCGPFGHCYHYMSGGFVFSTCLCANGYRGWDCSDDTQVPSSISSLVSTLVLILSNLFLIPSIYVAIRRSFYIESIIYFFAMVFSVFYHACDCEHEEHRFCLVKLEVLQFCDFYCGLMSIWATLVAISQIQNSSCLHMLGAILLAFATELNKQSLWAFLAPVLTGIILISASWGMRCFATRKCFPGPKYIKLHMSLGIIFVIIGLICYAFLQTRQNYYIVHSIWHIVMSMSIICLLPTSKNMPDETPRIS